MIYDEYRDDRMGCSDRQPTGSIPPMAVSYEKVYYHRLNGSSSPVLTATSLSYGKAKNSTPTESKPII